TATQFSNVGGYPITVRMGSHHDSGVTKRDAPMTVSAAVATVTANNKSKSYGAVNPALDATVAGQVVGGDAIAYTLATTATQFSKDRKNVVKVKLGSNPNYSVTKTDAKLTVSAAVA